MATRKLEVEIVGDSKSLERAFGRSTKASQQFETGLKGSAQRVDSLFTKTQKIAAGGFLGGVAATATISAIKTSVDAASDLNEQITKNQQVFGSSAAAVEEWSKTTAKSIGISQTAALEATGTFGNLFSAIGVAGPQAADTSKRLVQLAADLASFNNASPEDTLDAIRSGLIGEAEPLRRYGVLLSEARVAQVAMAQTEKDNAKALTAQEKAAARVAIIFKDTAQAQGDFERTSGGLANQQRILAAETKNLQANLGTLLLPAVKSLTAEMVQASGAAENLVAGLHALGRLEIPEITIPFGITIGGNRVSDLAGDAAHFAKFTPLNPLFGLTIANAIANQFRDQTKAATPGLAADFQKAVDDMNDAAIKQLSVSSPPVNLSMLPDTFKTLGPLIKDITPALNEQLLDAQISGNQKRIRAVLVKIQASLTEALDDPRLKQKGRIQIKTALKSVNDSIAAIDEQVAADSKAASDARTARLNKIADDAKTATAKHKAKLREIAENRAQLARDAAKAAKAAIQASQFRALGLSGAGDRPPPGIENLQKQLAQLSKRDDLTANQRGILARIRKVLIDPIHKATPETRAAVKELLDGVRDEFNKGTKDITGPLTKTSSLNTNKILDGLGLGRDMEKELRARLSSFNSAGIGLAGARRPTGGFQSQPVVIENHTTVSLDGETVGRSVTKTQQKSRRRNPTQKRGPNSGI